MGVFLRRREGGVEVLAQFFGFAAIVDSFFIFQQTKRRNMLILKVLQDLLWLVHYVLLACWSAAATSLICAFRGIVFYHNDKKWAKTPLWLAGFIGLYVLSAVLTWEDLFCLFPALSSCLSAVAFWVKDPRHTKVLTLFASASTFIYNTVHGQSLSVYIGLAITVISSVISLLQPLWNKKGEEVLPDHQNSEKGE